MDKLCLKFKFAQHFSSMYNAAANGLAEAFNKTLCNLLKKVVSKSKRDWHERIGEALWAYRTTHRTPTKATPYSLVYGVEAVLLLECQIPSLRIAIQEGLTDERKGNPRQHVAHFVETCNNASTYGDLMVKQFVRSLEDVAFEWYTDLPAGSVDSWDQLEREFLTRFYSTKRTVSLPELANTKQKKDESVTDFIERWRNLVRFSLKGEETCLPSYKA
ncbi:hypothetical protein SLEP1_g37967 [Rubroshorea leprosula]|uniref:Retrotransposon gag domain-containing protein n=1 Tax=Rubroshorea leprosula TaxID=152421 RepID=A0AAV5KWC1_9ROSI|nr:hypothetical protein SLEP1_g37967 [Rubroshorea leprosula]